jgi:hypothetical protein
MKITLKNDFHNTEVGVYAVEITSGTSGRTVGYLLSAQQTRRVRKRLCGIAGCACGDDLSLRGPQDFGDYSVDIDTRPYHGSSRIYLEGRLRT